jgi:CO/xanthine dehydrogenase Mo-binding subunit
MNSYKREDNKIMKKYSVVGKSLTRVDGIAKVTGRAKFTYDMELPNMLWGRILRSPYPHARIINIDTSEAKKLPGVKAVITGKDIGPIRYGFVDTPRYPADQLVLATEKVRYIGEEVAAVAAINKDIADEALTLIKVEYEELSAVFDPEEAMRDGAPEIHAEIIPDRPCAWEDWGIARKARSYKAEHNICAISEQGHGNIEKGFEESDYIREDRYYIPATSHAAMEPHGALASWDPAFQKLDVWLTHMGYEIKRYWLARTMGIPISKVRVHKAYVGGAFGGKIDPFAYEILAALLSRMTSRPVKISLTREEVFIACRLSHRFIINLKTGVKKDGTIMAQEVRAINDPGAYRGSSPVVLFLTHGFRRPIYNIPNAKHEAIGVYTNKTICMSKRGHGSPQMSFAAESQLDQIAEDLGMDPAELRLKNVRKVGDVLPNGDTLKSCGLTEAIQRAMELSGWREKRGKGKAQNRGIGMGIAAMFNGAQYYPFGAAATIKLNHDGDFYFIYWGCRIWSRFGYKYVSNSS